MKFGHKDGIPKEKEKEKVTEEKDIREPSKKISAFGDSVLRGVILDGDKYRVSKNSFASICEEVLGVRIENKAKFGSTVAVGEKSLIRSLDTIQSSNGEYIVLEFGGNDCDYNWKKNSTKNCCAKTGFTQTKRDTG